MKDFTKLTVIIKPKDLMVNLKPYIFLSYNHSKNQNGDELPRQ